MAYSKTTWSTGDVITAAKLNNAEDGIETAQSTAEAAQTAATAAQNTADTAQSTATGAASDAGTALSTANSAASDASTALTTANSAQSAAEVAASAASAAQDTANAVQTSLGGYLPLSGGTMTGTLNLGSNVLSGVAAGTNDTDAVNVSQLDALDDDLQGQIDGIKDGTTAVPSTYTLPVASADTLGGIKVGSNLSIDSDGTLSASGGGESVTYTGGDGISISGTEVSVDSTVARASDLAGKADASALANYLPLSGGTMEGALNLGGRYLYRANGMYQSESENSNHLAISGSAISLNFPNYSQSVMFNTDGRVSGVQDGTGDNDAVNLSQLNAVQTAAATAQSTAEAAQSTASSAATAAAAAQSTADSAVTAAAAAQATADAAATQTALEALAARVTALENNSGE